MSKELSKEDLLISNNVRGFLYMPKSTDINKKIKNKNLNVKVPEIEYTELQKISNQLGMSLSSTVRLKSSILTFK